MIVAAFLMCDGSEFQTEGPKWEKARSPFVLYLYSGSFRRRVSALERSGRAGNNYILMTFVNYCIWSPPPPPIHPPLQSSHTPAKINPTPKKFQTECKPTITTNNKNNSNINEQVVSQLMICSLSQQCSRQSGGLHCRWWWWWWWWWWW